MYLGAKRRYIKYSSFPFLSFPIAITLSVQTHTSFTNPSRRIYNSVREGSREAGRSSALVVDCFWFTAK